MAAAYIYPIIRMTHLITDNNADANFLARLEELGIRVILAED
jgi:DeoR/GlpR family transcriptional regulator of sugar metabolism